MSHEIDDLGISVSIGKGSRAVCNIPETDAFKKEVWISAKSTSYGFIGWLQVSPLVGCRLSLKLKFRIEQAVQSAAGKTTRTNAGTALEDGGAGKSKQCR